MKLSIASGGAPYDSNNNAHYSYFDSLFAEDEDELITLPIPDSLAYSPLEQLFADDDDRITIPASEEDDIVFF